MTRYEILEAPSVLGLFPNGVEGLSEVLLDAGLAERLAAARGPLVLPPAFAGGIDPESGVRNATALADYARALADEVGFVLSRGAFPIVLGGDCSILLGSLLALRRRGRHGLLFLDGHADFAHPSEDPAGEAASMDLALATGRGPKVVADIEDRGPLVRDDDVALLGYRVFTDGTDRHLGLHVRDTAILVHDLDDIRRDGLTAALEASLARVARRRSLRVLRPPRRRRPRRCRHACRRLSRPRWPAVQRGRADHQGGTRERQGRGSGAHHLQSGSRSGWIARARARRHARRRTERKRRATRRRVGWVSLPAWRGRYLLAREHQPRSAPLPLPASPDVLRGELEVDSGSGRGVLQVGVLFVSCPLLSQSSREHVGQRRDGQASCPSGYVGQRRWLPRPKLGERDHGGSDGSCQA